MPLRVVTIDVDGLFGSVADIVGMHELVPYRQPGDADVLVTSPVTGASATVRPPLQVARRYLLALVETNRRNLNNVHAAAHEYVDTMPPRMLSADGAPLATIAGWEFPAVTPVQAELPPLGVDRVCMVAVELEAILGVRCLFGEAITIERPRGTRHIVEAVVDTTELDGSAIHQHVYDALDDHPPLLRARLEGIRRDAQRGGYARRKRRQRADEPAPEWGEQE